MLNDIMERIEDVNFDVGEVMSMLNEEKTPFQNVFLQEIKQMAGLVREMVHNLKELALGFAGELTISDAMDALMMSLFYGTVPTKWTKLAWPSLRSLTAWMTDLQMRIDQLEGWVQNPIEIPLVTWLSGLINPQSFLTAIMQQSAQLNSWELDKLYIQTDITKKQAEEVDARTRDGAFVSGLALEGARWNMNQGMLENSKPREMYFPMPVVYCKSNFAASRPSTGIYSCPVYKTRQRGPTYVFSAQLKTKSKTAKWVLGGVALVMDVSD
jgi:dynein heavy chain